MQQESHRRQIDVKVKEEKTSVSPPPSLSKTLPVECKATQCIFCLGKEDLSAADWWKIFASRGDLKKHFHRKHLRHHPSGQPVGCHHPRYDIVLNGAMQKACPAWDLAESRHAQFRPCALPDMPFNHRKGAPFRASSLIRWSRLASRNCLVRNEMVPTHSAGSGRWNVKINDFPFTRACYADPPLDTGNSGPDGCK